MIRMLTNKDENVVMEYINKYEYETTFIYGNVRNFGLENTNKDIGRMGDYYGYFEDQVLKGIIPIYNLGSSMPHYESENVIKDFAEIFSKNNTKFLMGMKKIIDPIYDELREYKQGEVLEDAYLINNNMNEFTVEGLNFKNLNEINFQDAVEFTVEARRIGFNDDDENIKERIISGFKNRSKQEEVIFALKENKIVATASIQTFTDTISQIGGVYTTELERKNGYCKATISEICKRVFKTGKKPTLFVSKNNEPAYRAYKSIGFEFYDDYIMIKFQT